MKHSRQNILTWPYRCTSMSLCIVIIEEWHIYIITASQEVPNQFFLRKSFTDTIFHAIAKMFILSFLQSGQDMLAGKIVQKTAIYFYLLAFFACTYCWKTLCGDLAMLRLSVNMPTFVCSGKLLSGLDGCEGLFLLTAQANVLISLGLRDPPDHLLQPEQTISTAQCVELTEELRTV